MIKVAIIENGIRRHSKDVKDIIVNLKNAKALDVRVHTTNYPRHAISLAKEASESNDVIIALGGDGTAHEVLNGIMLGNQNVLFGIIPSGTGNDFQKSIGAFDSAKFLSAVIERKHQMIDIGAFESELTTTYFLNIADLGFGAKVVKTMNRQRHNGIRGKFSYALAILRTFFTYKKSSIEISAPEFSFEGRVLMVAFCNGSTFGHGLTIHPNAMIDSGEMAITIVGNVSLFTYVKNLNKLKKGIKIEHPEVCYESSKHLTLDSKNAVFMEADGEYYSNSLKEVKILPNIIRLIDIR